MLYSRLYVISYTTSYAILKRMSCFFHIWKRLAAIVNVCLGHISCAIQRLRKAQGCCGNLIPASLQSSIKWNLVSYQTIKEILGKRYCTLWCKLAKKNTKKTVLSTRLDILIPICLTLSVQIPVHFQHLLLRPQYCRSEDNSWSHFLTLFIQQKCIIS